MVDEEMESIGSTNVNKGQHNVDIYLKTNSYERPYMTKVECDYFINLPPMQGLPYLNVRLFMTDGTVMDVPYHNIMRFEYINLDEVNKQMSRHFERFNQRIEERGLTEETGDDNEEIRIDNNSEDVNDDDHNHCQMFG